MQSQIADTIPADRGQLMALIERCERISAMFSDPAFIKALTELRNTCRARLSALGAE
jgi:hypothetical protein